MQLYPRYASGPHAPAPPAAKGLLSPDRELCGLLCVRFYPKPTQRLQ